MASDFSVPKEWADEERMYFLMSPFPPNSHPSLSDPKVTFWKSLIYSSCRELCILCFTERQMTERLSWNGLQSKNLPVVISTLEKAGELQRLSSYQLKGWVDWGKETILYPLSWVWNRYIVGEPSREEVYVIVPLLKELSDQVLNEHFNSVLHIVTDSVLSINDFRQLLQNVTNSSDPASLQAIEYQLITDQKITKSVCKETNEVIVKFAASKNEKVLPITDIDIGIFNISNVVAILRKKLEHQNSHSLNIKKKCLEYKRNGQQKNALMCFKRLKTVTKSLLNLEEQLFNLTTILEQIQTAETNTKVLKAYETGTAALKLIRENGGLNLDRIEDVMDNMKEIIEEGNELDQVLSTQADFFEFDENELLKELDNLTITDEEAQAVPRKTIATKTQTKIEFQKDEEQEIRTNKKLKPILLSS